MPKKTSLFLIFLSLVLIFAAFLIFYLLSKNPQSSFPKNQTINIVLNENGFTPNEITINPGDSIKFTTTLGKQFWPASDLHPTHGIYPEFDPHQPIESNNSWTFQFLKTGRWKYHDHLQPTFRGIIIVK